jgi:hypothetical protein
MMMGKTRDTRTIGGAIITLNGITIKSQCRSKFDNWGEAHIHIFVFTDHKTIDFKRN